MAACDNVIVSTGQVIPLDEAARNHLKDTIECFASESLRTLCLAYMEIGTDFSPKNAIPVRGYTCIGIVGIKDPVRPGVRESVAICRSAGITVRMVTGDNINTAKAIARECGILTDGGLAIEGPEFREKSVEEMIELIPKIQVCFIISIQSCGFYSFCLLAIAPGFPYERNCHEIVNLFLLVLFWYAGDG